MLLVFAHISLQLRIKAHELGVSTDDLDASFADAIKGTSQQEIDFDVDSVEPLEDPLEHLLGSDLGDTLGHVEDLKQKLEMVNQVIY